MSLFPKHRDLTKPVEEVELEVDASFLRQRVSDVSLRLDQFLTLHLTWRSRSSIQSLIKDGYVLVDASTPEHPRGTGRPVVEKRPGRKLLHGSRVTIVIPEELRTTITEPVSGDLDVLYEDEEVVAVDKPPGLVVHPSGRHLADTLIQRVHKRYESGIEAGRLVPRLCHRLDRETSGIVLIGKRPLTHSEVMRQFEEREVEKDYLAIVHGELAEESGSVQYRLAPSRVSRIGLKMAVVVDGLASRTDWQVVEHYQGYSLVRCRLHTGRQHEIRVHLAAIGHPVVGDKLYGMDDELFERGLDGDLSPEDLALLELPRHALHNHRLVFVTPAGGRQVEITSPLARDMAELLETKLPA